MMQLFITTNFIHKLIEACFVVYVKEKGIVWVCTLVYEIETGYIYIRYMQYYELSTIYEYYIYNDVRFIITQEAT
jgi:hypothetical protein